MSELSQTHKRPTCDQAVTCKTRPDISGSSSSAPSSNRPHFASELHHDPVGMDPPNPSNGWNGNEDAQNGPQLPLGGPHGNAEGENVPGNEPGLCVPGNDPGDHWNPSLEEAQGRKPTGPDAELLAQEYYHGLLPRDDVQNMLTQQGDFIVRTTEIKSGSNRQYCLSAHWNGNNHHFLLAPNLAGMYTLDHGVPGVPEFPSVFELVTFHKRSSTPFSHHKIVLLNPVYRQEWELRHEQIVIQRQLGEGAFGEVCSGDLHMNNTLTVPVAVKKMKTKAMTKEKIEELMKEARLMRPCVTKTLSDSTASQRGRNR
ncbi:hypothetical protein L596_019579 [Steinernema carpocapsae]|uniref:Tyrosine-protein kinase n=1 Tax=Steinernema carpocapsae TaxID=34508 RepID=A0A4U5MRS1_STECR|nr:hypothetical protein L596_019579 [Steinernema carpocapsae]